MKNSVNHHVIHMKTENKETGVVMLNSVVMCFLR